MGRANRYTESWLTKTGHPSWTHLIGGHGTLLHGACHSSDSLPLLFIFQRNVIGLTNLFLFATGCYLMPNPCTSWAKVYIVPSRNVIRKQDIWVRPISDCWTENTLYLFEWFWRIYSVPVKQIGWMGAVSPDSKCSLKQDIWVRPIWLEVVVVLVIALILCLCYLFWIYFCLHTVEVATSGNRFGRAAG